MANPLEIEVHPYNAVSIAKCIFRLHCIVVDVKGLPEELSSENSRFTAMH
jgi:hypothetical protein